MIRFKKELECMSPSESKCIHNCCFSATDTEMSVRPREMQVEGKGAGTGVRDLSNEFRKCMIF